MVKTGVKLGAKFINKMIKQVKDNLIPKDIPAFVRSLFVKQTAGRAITLPAAAKTSVTNNQDVIAVSGKATNKRKSDGNKSGGKKKSRKEISNKSLKMGLFHVKQGTPTVKALPEKDKLKDKICLDFCLHWKKCNFPHQLNKHGKHYTNWKNVPEANKPVLLSLMNETGLMWLNAETFEKHKQTQAIPSEFVHFLGNTAGPNQRLCQRVMSKTMLNIGLHSIIELNQLVSNLNPKMSPVL
jgi:hypothetical protein